MKKTLRINVKLQSDILSFEEELITRLPAAYTYNVVGLSSELNMCVHSVYNTIYYHIHFLGVWRT